ncbi:hypothetical protein P6U16_01305 [Rhizobium sp. 32-5/1]|uniref:hypothetical protein n=1 Tax=Rhizobium sp. 32-5/1 TaxID=3019602 RepID=UPI00240DEEF3|nr:hypothetical protein [Rhizobium sp. 32-5/1]WEZ83523.1 hypothetical protein P6U16_01305 [Rhizobium sp. 32-5/1]
MKPDLETRIADAFGAGHSSKEVGTLLQDVAQADAAARQASQIASQRALDPMTRPAEVASARKEMEDCDFRSKRFAIAIEKLKELKDETARNERSAAALEEFEAARTERDQLAEDIKEYPDLAMKIVSLIERLVASDQRIEAANKAKGSKDWLYSAEFLAVGSPPQWNNGSPDDHPRLTAAKLPLITPHTGYGWLWPRRSHFLDCLGELVTVWATWRGGFSSG